MFRTAVVDSPANRISVGCSDDVEEELRVCEDQIGEWCLNALAGAQANTYVDVRLVSEKEMASLNGTYRGKPKPTNVLSFPAFESEIHGDGPMVHLGDVAVCPAVLARECAEQNKPYHAHFAHMMTHGVLHLLGYDHIDETDAERMEQLERSLLAHIGIADPYQQKV